MTVLAVIPARGGSRRVPKKNIRMVAGRPLIEWTIEQALSCKKLDKVVVSSDDSEIIEIASKCGVETIRRPARLAEDQVSSAMAAVHALQAYKADFVVLLQPTSPLRSVEDIEQSIYISQKYQAPCVTVTPSKVKPEHLCLIDDRGCLSRLMMTCPPSYRLNGAVYVAPSSQVGMEFFTANTRAHVMPEERSLDIDTESQLMAAHEALTQKLYEMVTT